MGLGRSKSAVFLILFFFSSLACIVPSLLAKKKDNKDRGSTPISQGEQRRALHALNRLTFGPRPGDVHEVATIGVDRWIDLQLHPEKINDDALDGHLQAFRTLRMSSKELAEDFPDGQELNQVLNGKKSMPSDPALRMVYEVQIERHQEKKEERKEKETADKNASGAMSGKAPANGSSMAANSTVDNASAAQDNAGANPNSGPKAAPDSENTENTMAASVSTSTAAPAPPLTTAEKEEARLREEQLYADLEVQQLPNLPPEQRYKKIVSMKLPQQLTLADTLRGGKGQEFLEGMTPKQKETLLAMNNPQGVVTGEMAQAKLLRAIYSERQFEEVMTDFWFNHFNVFVDKGLDRVMLTSYERDVIRPHVFGKFEDLLVATAKSPAMLFYLDNWLSVGPDSPQALGLPVHPNGPYRRCYPPRPNQNKRHSGLNENYGRELLELHTLSVNGGYSQQDVTEAAKVFTGWTIDKPADGGGFKFDPRMHEPGPKVVLGHRIKPKDEGEGLELLHRLATSPQTAHFISLKLAERFVADDPPPALVDRMAKTFLKKKGDIREVLSTMFHSPEFWDDGTYRDKMKTPLEFVASAVRATGAEVDDALPLTRQLGNMGMPLYGAQPPTGYSMKAETWVSSSALLNRMNFALVLTSGKVKGVKLDVARLTESDSAPLDSSGTLAKLEADLLDGTVSKQTHDSIAAQIDSTRNSGQQKPDNKSGKRKSEDALRSSEVNTIAGLLLGSPEFQKR